MVLRFRVLTGVLLATALLAGWVYAQGPGGRGRFGGPGGPDAMFALRELNLTDAQRQQVRQVMDRYREEMRALQARMQTDIDALLTPEQREQAQKLRAEREERMQQRRERLQQR